VVILTLRYIETLPSTTLKWLARYAKELRENGNLLLVAGVVPHVFDLLERTEILNELGKENVFPAHRVVSESIEAAMDRGQSWLKEQEG
jgi:SulP family sulfate permease